MKRKVYLTSAGNKVRPVGRGKKLHIDKNDNFYFMFNNSRYYLSDVYKLNNKNDCTAESFNEGMNLHMLVGGIGISNVYGLLVELFYNDYYEECVQLYEYVEIEV